MDSDIQRISLFSKNLQQVVSSRKHAQGVCSSCRRHKLSDLLLEHCLHVLVAQVVCDGGEEVACVVALRVAAALWESRHDGLVVAQDLQAAQEQRLRLASWHHHLE